MPSQSLQFHMLISTQKEGLNNPSTSDADSVDDDEQVAVSDGESGAQKQVREPVVPIPFDVPRRNLRAGFDVLDGMSLPEIFVGAVREHARDSGWQGIRKCGAGSEWVEAVFLLAQLVVVQFSEGRFVRGGLVSKRKLQERMRLGPTSLRKQQHRGGGEHKWQCGNVVNSQSGELRGPSDSHFWVSCQQEDSHLRGPPSPLSTLSTLSALTNPVRRPAALREPLHDDLTQFVLEHDFQFDPDMFWPMFGQQGGALQQGRRA